MRPTRSATRTFFSFLQQQRLFTSTTRCVQRQASKRQDAPEFTVLELWASQASASSKPPSSEEVPRETAIDKQVSLPKKKNDTPTFTDLGVSPKVASSLSDLFAANIPSPCQTALIPSFLAHSDIMLKDVTGAGKTLGLIAAVLSKRQASWMEQPGQKSDLDPERLHSRRYLQSLIMVPTRELAIQITTWIREMKPNVMPADQGKYVQCVINGVEEDMQLELLKEHNPRIIVGTPQRLLSLHERGGYDTSRLQTLILDEVDRLVEVVQRYDPIKTRFNKSVHPLAGQILVERIMKERRAATKTAKGVTSAKNPGNKRLEQIKLDPAYRRLQVVICSATLNNNLRRELTLKKKWLENPVLLDITGTSKAPDQLQHQCLVYNSETQFVPLEQVLEQYKSAAQEGEYPSDFDGPAIEDAADQVLEEISKICYSEKVRSGLVFAHSSTSITHLVGRLNSLGLKANKLFNEMDYSQDSLGSLMPLDKDSTSSEVSSPETELPAAATPIQSPPPKPFSSFLSGRTQLLVMTEYEARGLDLPNATHIFILGPPSSPASYLHMAGRAGRYGREGKAYTLLGGTRYAKRVGGMFKLLRIEPAQQV
ncbi:P-loop containing nucleoside triphosphate hydrolase protein [Phlyctochytrium arcticum]|nr:P-loop containing nucleoside triphosphate hydrolase protein [Phlyctochytrium arcticum]